MPLSVRQATFDNIAQKSAKSKASPTNDIEGKKLLTASTEIVEGKKTDGFDENSTGLESLGVLGAANLKMKMKNFKKVAHENQNKSENVGEENAVPSTNEEV